MATLSPSGSNRTRLSAAASFHYRRPRRRPDTRSGLSIHTLTTRDGPSARRVPAGDAGERTARRAAKTDGPNAASHSQSHAHSRLLTLLRLRGMCQGFVRSTESGFSFRISPQHSESDTGGPHARLVELRPFRGSLTSFRPFVSSSRRSGLGVSRDRRGTGGARAADNMTVAAPWPRGP